MIKEKKLWENMESSCNPFSTLIELSSENLVLPPGHYWVLMEKEVCVSVCVVKKEEVAVKGVTVKVPV